MLGLRRFAVCVVSWVFSLVEANRGYPLVAGLLIAAASLVEEHKPSGVQASAAEACGLSSCRARVLRAQALWSTGLVAPHNVRSSQPRDRTHASCVGRQILYL